MKNDQTLIFISFFTAISFLVWFFLFFGVPFTNFSFGLLPQYRLWVLAEEKKVTLTHNKKVYEDRFNFLNDSLKERKKLRSFAIENESDQFTLLGELELLGKRFNASTTIVSIVQKTITENKGVKKVSTKNTAPVDSSLEIQLTSKGSFVNVMRFLKGLETMPHLVRINKVQLRLLTDTKARTNTTWEAGVVIEIFGIKKAIQ
jgi:hypothetical protein